MAFMKQAKTEDDIKKMTVSNVKKAYNELAVDYNHLIDWDYLLCPKCGEFLTTKTAFYSDNRYVTGYFPVCKKCLLAMAEQRKKKNDPPNETKDSVKNTLMFMDLPYMDNLYESIKKSMAEDVGERTKQSSFTAYMTPIKSLPQYKGLCWKDSDFGVQEEADFYDPAAESKKNEKLIKAGRKRFGSSYKPEEILFLESEYQDWISRYPCDSKSQEVLFRRLCCQELDADRAQKNGINTKDIDKSIQDTMTSLGIKPSQRNADSMADNLTFGQLIDKWENEKPIPEPSDEFKDVDRIGTYIDVFFKGHLAKMMGLKNAFSAVYDKFMSKYTVNKSEMVDEDEEALFTQLFGSRIDEDE
jgi:hypothetical protein